MTYLIFSDSHGGMRAMARVVKRCPDVQGIIFLGDCVSDALSLQEHFPDYDYRMVAGNCDISAKYLAPEWQEQIFTLEGKRILIGHGHRWQVKCDTRTLEKYARGKDIDVALFGHTHIRCEKCLLPEREGERPLYIFNPGSVFMPRDGEPSFGTLTIRGGSILLGHGEVYI